VANLAHVTTMRNALDGLELSLSTADAKIIRCQEPMKSFIHQFMRVSARPSEVMLSHRFAILR
jgi:hypothetical protein